MSLYCVIILGHPVVKMTLDVPKISCQIPNFSQAHIMLSCQDLFGIRLREPHRDEQSETEAVVRVRRLARVFHAEQPVRPVRGQVRAAGSGGSSINQVFFHYINFPGV